MADPYAAQLKGFTSSIPNARRGLIDLYKTAAAQHRSHYNEMGKLYGGRQQQHRRAVRAASQQAIGGFGAQGLKDVAASGYDMGDADTRAAVRGMLKEGTSPFAGYLKTEGAAQGALYRGLKGAEQYEDKTLKTGLAREQPAALSELEQGIIDTQTQPGRPVERLPAAQSQFQAQQQQYMQQMLSYQGQIAGGAQGWAPAAVAARAAWRRPSSGSSTRSPRATSTPTTRPAPPSGSASSCPPTARATAGSSASTPTPPTTASSWP